MNRVLLQGAVGAAVLAAVGLSAVIVEETEFAVVTRFGRVTQVIAEPGLAWKLPAPIDQALRLDKRILMTPVPEAEFLTADKKNVMVGMYINWRIADPVRFLGAVRTRTAAELRLVSLLQSALGSALGERPFTDFVPATPDAAQGGSQDRLLPLENSVRERSQRVADSNLGIEIVDLGITRFNFPDQNLVAVFSRMRAERKRIANAYRSEGDAEAHDHHLRRSRGTHPQASCIQRVHWENHRHLQQRVSQRDDAGDLGLRQSLTRAMIWRAIS